MFNLGDIIDFSKADDMSPLVLAFIGDAVYTLYVREKLAFNSSAKAGDLHVESSKIVKATAQADLMEKIMPLLTENELNVFKRARNAKKGTKAKSATVAEYNLSTGFEALIGYLYITGKTERINELLNCEDN